MITKVAQQAVDRILEANDNLALTHIRDGQHQRARAVLYCAAEAVEPLLEGAS